MMRRIPLAGLKKRLEELEAQAPELIRAIETRSERARDMALSAVTDEQLDLMEVSRKRLSADPATVFSADEVAAWERFNGLENQFAAQLTAAAARIVPGNGHGSRDQLRGLIE
jgi:hypothetical protein